MADSTPTALVALVNVPKGAGHDDKTNGWSGEPKKKGDKLQTSDAHLAGRLVRLAFCRPA